MSHSTSKDTPTQEAKYVDRWVTLSRVPVCSFAGINFCCVP